MANVTIKLTKGTGSKVDWDPPSPTAKPGDVVRWECPDGQWWITFKDNNGPLHSRGLNGKRGANGRKGSKVKVKTAKHYDYVAVIWDQQAQKLYSSDPPLDIVPGT